MLTAQARREILHAARTYAIVLVVSVALIVAGDQLTGLHPLARHILSEFGIAGLVGFILALTIERLSKKEFRRLAEEERLKINKDVFYNVYGHHFPAAIRDEIDAFLELYFVRKNVEMKYELRKVQDPESLDWYVLSRFTMEYEIENLRNDEQSFPFLAGIDKSPSAALAGHTQFILVSARGCKTTVELDAAELATILTIGEAEFVLDMPDRIVVLPGHRTFVKTMSQTVRYLRGGRIDVTFTSHICDLKLTIDADPDLLVSASTSDHKPLQRTQAVRDPLLGATHYTWKQERPLLANESLHIAWTSAEIDKSVEV